MFELSIFSLDTILSFGTKMLAFIGGLAALIFVHELGHFLVARKVGVVVEKFSLGFGPFLGYPPRWAIFGTISRARTVLGPLGQLFGPS